MKVTRVLLIIVALIEPVGALLADGGVVRFSKEIGNYRVTVFTSPVPLRSGPVDVSVFVQDAATGGTVSELRITVRVSPHEHPDLSIMQPATTEAATNKLFQSAIFDLPHSGLWDVNILIEGLNKPIEMQFEMEVSEALPRVWDLASWIAWPAVVVGLFCVHKWLVERKQRRSRRVKKAGSHSGEPALVTCRPIT